MACDAVTLEGLAAADQLAQLSDRSLLAVLSNLYGAGMTASAVQATAVSNGYFALSELELWQCLLAALCTGTCDATSLATQTGLNKYDRWSQRDIFEAMVAAACNTGCSATTLEASMAANGFDRLAERELLATLVASACVSGCSAKTLFAAAVANGYDKFSFRELTKAIVYVICNSGGAGGGTSGNNLIPGGSTYSNDTSPIFNLTVLPNSTYVITWGGNDQTMTMGGVIYTTCGVGCQTFVYTGPNTNMAFVGTNGGTLVTVTLFLAPKATPVPGDFALVANSTYTNLTASWDAPPAGVGFTELWTSTDNITFTLAQTIAAPGASATLAIPAVGSTIYAKVRWHKLNYGAFSPVLQYLNTTWATRAFNNSTFVPAAASTAVQNNLYNALANFGILNKILTCSLIPNENHANIYLTPLIKASGGADPWGVSGFGDGSATANGITGTFSGGAAADLLQPNMNGTGFPSDASGGIVVYAFTGASEAGAFDAGNTNNAGTIAANIQVNNGGSSKGNLWNNTTGQVSVASPGAGYYSIQRVSATDLRMYYAKSTTAHAQIGSTQAGAAGSRPASGCDFFAAFDPDQAQAVLSTGHTLSFCAFTAGLKAQESLYLFTAVQAALVAKGGGFV